MWNFYFRVCDLNQQCICPPHLVCLATQRLKIICILFHKKFVLKCTQRHCEASKSSWEAWVTLLQIPFILFMYKSVVELGCKLLCCFMLVEHRLHFIGDAVIFK